MKLRMLWLPFFSIKFYQKTHHKTSKFVPQTAKHTHTRRLCIDIKNYVPEASFISQGTRHPKHFIGITRNERPDPRQNRQVKMAANFKRDRTLPPSTPFCSALAQTSMLDCGTIRWQLSALDGVSFHDCRSTSFRQAWVLFLSICFSALFIIFIKKSTASLLFLGSPLGNGERPRPRPVAFSGLIFFTSLPTVFCPLETKNKSLEMLLPCCVSFENRFKSP